MSYKLNVLHDNPVGFWILDETSGSIAADSSAYGNHSEYVGSLNTAELPLVIDSQNSTLIDSGLRIEYSISKDDYQNSSTTSFATKETSDNDFSLECWIKPNIVNKENKIPLFGDIEDNIGIFFQYNKVIFSLQDEELSYSVPNSNRGLYIVCVYSKSSMSIYVNAELVAYKYVDNISFTNNEVFLKSGPTNSYLDSFIIDCPAAYRYSLNGNQIKNHYYSAQGMPAIQIASPEDGELFKIQDTGVSRQFEYTYPGSKGWESFDNLNLSYNKYDNSLSLNPNASELVTIATATITDFISIPLGFDLNSSKIEWQATEGVEVYASVDNIIFVKCQNGFPVPKYKFGPDNFYENRSLYLSIRFNSEDSREYLPKIYSLMVAFYNNKKIYSFNGGSTISHLADQSKQSDISFGNSYSNILLRDYKNGIVCSNGSGFSLNTQRGIQTVEFFYTPHLLGIIGASIVDVTASTTQIFDSVIEYEPVGDLMTLATAGSIIQAKSTLIYHEDSGLEYSWSESGDVTQNSIYKIYINGVDKTSESNILESLKPGSLYHVVIVFDEEISGDLQFNYSSSGSAQATYQNIITYPSKFTSNKCLDHFNMWIGRYRVSASDSSVTLTENSVTTYANDWQVLQTA